jgi:hypothetical protein
LVSGLRVEQWLLEFGDPETAGGSIDYPPALGVRFRLATERYGTIALGGDPQFRENCLVTDGGQTYCKSIELLLL